MNSRNLQRIHVAVAAIVNQRDEVLVTRRPASTHQGGRWEFPGGKLEGSEAVDEALARELYEELGVRPIAVRPLIRIAHDYPDKQVLLDTWRVDAIDGVPKPREHQPMRWVAIRDLGELDFPAANKAIVTALQLPCKLLITPDRGADRPTDFVRTLHDRLRRHRVTLVQLRIKQCSEQQYLKLAHKVLEECKRTGVKLMLNGQPRLLEQVDAHGLHLPGTELSTYHERPIDPRKYLSVAVHDEREIALASRLSPDFVLLSPVQETTSHPGAEPLGWTRFRRLTELLNVPVFALGGLVPDDVARAQRHGGQGIAAISAFWCE